jgi:hypothetical protein
VRVGIYAMENNKTVQWGLRKKKATKKKYRFEMLTNNLKLISSLFLFLGFAKGSFRSVLLTFFQSYVEHHLRKNKIVVTFFCQLINFYELIVRF